MTNNKKILIEEWIKRADDDERNAVATLKYKEGTPAQVCFLAQQIAEKYFKTLLLFYTDDYPKTHDLNQLATLLKPFNKSIFDFFEKEINLLSSYYIGTRYPADIPIESFTWDEAQNAFESAKKIKDFVIKQISL